MELIATAKDPVDVDGKGTSFDTFQSMQVWGNCSVQLSTPKNSKGRSSPYISIFRWSGEPLTAQCLGVWDLSSLFVIPPSICIADSVLWLPCMRRPKQYGAVAVSLEHLVLDPSAPPVELAYVEIPTPYNFASIASSGSLLIAGLRGRARPRQMIQLFEGSGGGAGSELASIMNPFPSDAESFGRHVVGEADKLFVQCANDDTIAWNAGAVYQYALSEPSKPTLARTLYPNAVENTLFGESLALGDWFVAVGAPAEEHGYVYLFDKSALDSDAPVGIIRSREPVDYQRGGIRHGTRIDALGNVLVVFQIEASRTRYAGKLTRYSTNRDGVDFGQPLEDYIFPDYSGGTSVDFLRDGSIRLLSSYVCLAAVSRRKKSRSGDILYHWEIQALSLSQPKRAKRRMSR
ncbi:MAG: hypothetical protein M9915_17880 [Rhizobacter sp.]|nr:hypothetical protein [Rhizobacter sp.]